MWYVHATSSWSTFSGVTCVAGENRMPPGSCPYVGHSREAVETEALV
jgi:hypothetical protein